MSDGLALGSVACVVDDHPRFHLEALRWYATATRVAAIPPTSLVVNLIGPTTDVTDYLAGQGVKVHLIERFDTRSPHSNKIAGALRLAADLGRSPNVVVLTDTDVLLRGDPRTIGVAPGGLAAKPVDDPNPPIELLGAIFAQAGLELPPLVPLELGPGRTTVAGNGNGGLYVLSSGAVLERFALAWERWTRWLLDRQELLGAFAVHVDQVGAALAVAAEQIRWERLPLTWNLPTHVEPALLARALEPYVVHYHQRVENTGLVSLVGIPTIDRVIDRCNRAIASVFHEAFPNATFWDWRYRTNRALGSGVGSRGTPLAEKRELIARIVDECSPLTVLDVGCGDGEATRGLELGRYTGIDVSAEAAQLVRAGRPDAVVHVGTLDEWFTHADLVLCLDVLIHMARRDEYEQLVRLLLEAARRRLLVAGYEQPPTIVSPMVHFHEPLSVTLRRFAPEATIEHLREVHGITTWLVSSSEP